MNVRTSRTPEEPATEAAHFITRFAIGLLLVATPIASVVTRRAVYVLVPVGVVLILVAWLLEPGSRGPRQLRSALLSSTGLILIFLVCWAGLSLIWTPFAVGPSERFVKSASTFVLAAAAAALLPERTRTSNLYLLPIGVGLGAMAIAALAVFGQALGSLPADPGVNVLGRASFGVALLVWPALGALAIREKTRAAIALAALTIIAQLLAGVPLALTATAFGALVFAAALSDPHRIARILGIAGAAAFVLSPIPVLLVYWLTPATSAPTFLQPMIAWGDLLAKEGVRTFIGHGFDASRLGVWAGYLSPSTPHSILFEAWFELGFVGIVAAALLTAQVARRAGQASAAIAPFLLAGLTAAFVLCAFGLGIAPVWWVTLLALDGLAFALLQHGQARRRRPGVADLGAGV
jgi:hypothetical protein